MIIIEIKLNLTLEQSYRLLECLKKDTAQKQRKSNYNVYSKEVLINNYIIEELENLIYELQEIKSS